MNHKVKQPLRAFGSQKNVDNEKGLFEAPKCLGAFFVWVKPEKEEHHPEAVLTDLSSLILPLSPLRVGRFIVPGSFVKENTNRDTPIADSATGQYW